MRSVIFPLIAVLLAVQVITAQDSPSPDQASHGISLAREGRYAEAEQELRQAVRAAPAVAQYRAQLGSVLGLRGKWKEALESFQKAVDLSPQNLDFRRETAAVQWQMGLMLAAEKNLDLVLAKQPSDPGAILLLGLVKEKIGDYTTAAQLLGSQFNLVTTQPDRTVALFHSLVDSGQFDKSARIIEVLKLHAKDQQWMNAVSSCTRLALTRGDLETSEALFALIPEDDPERQITGLQLAKLLYAHGHVPQARELLLHLPDQGAADADIQALLGSCFEAERQPSSALQAYMRAIQASPQRVEYYEDPIALLLYLHKTAEAMALVDKALALAPSDARPWVWKGNADLRRNAYLEARESYGHAAELDRTNADAHLGVAAAYFVTGQSDAAISAYKAGIARFPNDARFYIACAEMLLASPDSLKLQAQAESLLQKAIKLVPQSAEARYQLGQLALQQGRLKDAEAELALSLQSDPDRSKPHFALSAVYRRMGRADDAKKEFSIYQDLKQTEENGATGTVVMDLKPYGR